MESTSHGRALLAAACCLLVAGPFLVVRFPPITDLPQHVAQIRLFLETLGNPNGPYRIQWFTPYGLSYGLIGTSWALVGAAGAGRLTMVVLAVLWTLAVHALAARRKRPAAAAVLVSLLFFNHLVYWGFLSFAVGWLAFVAWFLLTGRPPERPFRWTDALLYCAGAALLYFSHALWFAIGVGWLVFSGLWRHIPRSTLVGRAASILPVAVAAAIWYPRLQAQGFVSPTVWFDSPLERLTPAWMVDATLGGLRGSGEYLVLGLLLAWLGAGLWQNRDALRARIDTELLAAGLIFASMALTLPDEYMNTIQFAARWMPVGVICLVLAVPAPRFLLPGQRAIALAVLAVFCLTTAAAWKRFERDELSGLAEVLAALPDEPRVVGLDFVKESAIVKGRPFLQMFDYAQVLHGGSANFSFAGFAPALVVYRHRMVKPWTIGLEWFAERVKPADFHYFDYAIINGRPDTHAAAAAQEGLQPVTAAGRWRLYRVVSATS